LFHAPAGATKDMGKMLGGEEEKDPDAEKKEEERQEALKQQEDERKAKYAKMEAEREGVRQGIRDKVRQPMLPSQPTNMVSLFSHKWRKHTILRYFLIAFNKMYFRLDFKEKSFVGDDADDSFNNTPFPIEKLTRH